MTTFRQRFFDRLAGKDPYPALFMPDISTWYQAHRIDVEHGAEQKYFPGEVIPDADPMHKLPGTMPEKYRRLTHKGIHRALNVGLPVHNYHWLKTTYDGVGHRIVTEGFIRTEVWETPHGALTRRYRLAPDDGSWAIVEHPVTSVSQFPALVDIFEAQRYGADMEQIRALAAEIGEDGYQDLPIERSPLGLLVHEFVGMEGFVYMLHDERSKVEGMMEYLAQKRCELAGVAAAAPARVIILSDHVDENLLAPPLFGKYAVPFYRRFTEILHSAGKIVTCHMDGNLKRLLPCLRETGLDYYDGTTPAPMNNYEVEDLAAELPRGMHAFHGVPSTLFVQGATTEEILAYARRIIDVLGDRAILNVGDILPINGDIDKVAAIAEMVNAL